MPCCTFPPGKLGPGKERNTPDPDITGLISIRDTIFVQMRLKLKKVATAERDL